MGELFIVDSPALRTAVAGLYSTFARYPLGKVVGCPHCVYPEDIARIHSAPLRALTPDQLSKYAWKAMTTWGDEADFKHFAPRLFEIAIYDAFGYGLDFLLGKLEYGHFDDWPVPEQQAFRDLFRAWWQAFLAVYPNTEGTAHLLKLLAPYLDDVRPYLADLLGTDEAVQCHLVEFCGDLGELFGLQPPQWPYAPQAAQQVMEWFMDDATLPRLRAAYARFVAIAAPSPNTYAWLPYAIDDLLGVTVE